MNKLSRGSSRQQLIDSEIYSNSYAKQTCDSVVGKWGWFDGNFATFSSDGTMGGNPIYFWRCNGINPVRVTVNWNNKGIDKLTLSPDGKKARTNTER